MTKLAIRWIKKKRFFFTVLDSFMPFSIWLIMLACVLIDGVGPTGGLGADDRAVCEGCWKTAKIKTHVIS